MSYAIGSLVRARGRDWVVLADSTDDLLVLRPLGGTDDEGAGVLTTLEDVSAAQFGWPSIDDVGDFRSGRLLRDALRIGFRSAAGPLRSVANIAVTPRPYQLVPLLMALRQEVTRLLVADDVGIGKTVEAALIARERLDQGDVSRLCVLCPPHLAEQWQHELSEKFHIDAELVLAGTAARLDRRCPPGRSIFETFPHVVVSIDFIKSDRHRDEFLRSCGDFVIVDEAHQAASGATRGRQQRHDLLKRLAADTGRHLVLVSATPHSGDDDAFRSLLTLLDPEFARLPANLSGRENEAQRRRVAAHLVQRRRGDIRRYLDEDTSFPEREDADATYRLTEAYRGFLRDVWNFARERVERPGTDTHQARVRWWSALSLLRACGSSPAAAIATFANRAPAAATSSGSEADTVGARVTLDEEVDAADEASDVTPGAALDDTEGTADTEAERRRFLALSRRAAELEGDSDAKLQKATKLLRDLLADGYAPIVFCRFVDTAKYVAAHLAAKLKGVHVVAVTGELPHDEREARVATLAEASAEDRRRVLVATDCLSEGINLQDHFDAVLHYDLAWNPTRHEQRAGRVDRFGQDRPTVRVVTFWGEDNPIDAKVGDVLIRKHDKIKKALGISVPVPVDSNEVMEALLAGMLEFDWDAVDQLAFDLDATGKALDAAWTKAADTEAKSRSLFAQHTIAVDEVSAVLDEMRAAIGSPAEIEAFVRDAAVAAGATVEGRPAEVTRMDLAEAPPSLRDRVGRDTPASFEARFDLPVADGVEYLSRTHPVTTGLAQWVLDTALDPEAPKRPASRAGVTRTRDVTTATTVLLLRLRHHITLRRERREQRGLAEEAALVAFTGSPSAPQWIAEDEVEALLAAVPHANVTAELARKTVGRLVDARADIDADLATFAAAHAHALAGQHARLRSAAAVRGHVSVEANLPVDVLGMWILLPVPT